MKSVKVTTVILALALCISVFAACATETSVTESSATTKSTAEPSKTTTTATEPAEIIKIYASTTSGLRYRDTPQQENVHQAIIDATGIELIMVPYEPADYLTRIDLALTAGEPLDILSRIDPNPANKYYKNGAVRPLTLDEFKEHAPNLMEYFSDKLDTIALKDGNFAGVPRIFSIPSGRAFLMLRTDWAVALTGKKPATVEEFEMYLDAVLTKDPNGNGEADEIPLIFQNVDYYINSFAPAYLTGGGYWYLNSENKATPPELDENYPSLLAKLVEWMRDYVYVDNLVADTAQLRQLVAQNKVGASASTWTNQTLLNAWDILLQTVPGAVYDIHLVTGKTGINKYPEINDFTGYSLITAQCENPIAALKIIDFQISEEGYNLVTVGVEGDNYHVNDDGSFTMRSADPLNLNASNYINYYLIHETTPAWRTKLYMLTMWNYIKMNSYVDYVNNELPQFKPFDFNINYNMAEWTSASKLNDLTTFLLEAKVSVLLGDRPVSDWTAIMDEWLNLGGRQMIEDKTKEYFSLKK
jgi:ABC-type glycerol-3-phosphate transport system substrate-binding protein